MAVSAGTPSHLVKQAPLLRGVPPAPLFKHLSSWLRTRDDHSSQGAPTKTRIGATSFGSQVGPVTPAAPGISLASFVVKCWSQLD